MGAETRIMWTDHTADELYDPAKPCGNAKQASRVRVIAMVLDGASRTEATRAQGMELRVCLVKLSFMFLLWTLLSAGTALAQTRAETTAESAELADAFAELEALSAIIASRLQQIVPLSDMPAAPPPLGAASPTLDQVSSAGSSGPAVAPPAPAFESHDIVGAGTVEAEPDSCETRGDMDLRIGEVEERFDGFRQIINTANGNLPTYREDVRDIEKVCTPQVNGNIASAINTLDGLEIRPAYELAVELLACVDQRRRTIDGELNRPGITTIRIRILTDELERLTDTTQRVQDMEQALLRADSKQRRLVEELKQFKQEITSACDT